VHRGLEGPQAPGVRLAARLVGPLLVELLGNARRQQLKRRLGRACVEEPASLNQINGHRAVQAEIPTARVHQQLVHVRKCAMHLPQGRPKALSGELGTGVRPKVLCDLPTGMRPRVQRQIGDQLARPTAGYVDQPPVVLHTEQSQHSNAQHIHTVGRPRPGGVAQRWANAVLTEPADAG